MGVFNGLKYRSAEAEREWLKECFTGVLKDNFHWIEDREVIRKECGQCLSVKYLVGDLVLIQSLSNESVEVELSKWKEWATK